MDGGEEGVKSALAVLDPMGEPDWVAGAVGAGVAEEDRVAPTSEPVATAELVGSAVAEEPVDELWDAKKPVPDTEGDILEVPLTEGEGVIPIDSVKATLRDAARVVEGVIGAVKVRVPAVDVEAVELTVAPYLGDRDGVDVGDPVPPPSPAAVQEKVGDIDPPTIVALPVVVGDWELEAVGAGGRVTVPVAPNPRETLGLGVGVIPKGVTVAFTEPVLMEGPSGVAELLDESVGVPDKGGLEDTDLVPHPALAVPCCTLPDGVLPGEDVIATLTVLATWVGVIFVVGLP